MPTSKPVTLALASFMDSDEARALDVSEADVRAIAERFLSVSYDDLGAEPAKLDGSDVEAAIGKVLPRRFKPADPLAEHVPAVLRAYLAHLETSQVVMNAFEQRRGLEESIDAFLETVQSGSHPQGHGHAPPKDPFEHGAPKLGRNEPCFCGSGKKFKKCHGKGA